MTIEELRSRTCNVFYINRPLNGILSNEDITFNIPKGARVEYLAWNDTRPEYVTVFFTSGIVSLQTHTFTLPLSCLDLELNKKRMSNLKEKFLLGFLKEPEKSFRKAEITNGDGFLTDDGVKVFLGFLLKEFGDKFKTEVVDEILKEEK